MTASLYDVLGVPSTATPEALKAAYRRLAGKWHPDRNPDDPAGARAKFEAIKDAYDVLSDPDTRAQYDLDGTFETSRPPPNPEAKAIPLVLEAFNHALNHTSGNPLVTMYDYLCEILYRVDRTITQLRQAVRDYHEILGRFTRRSGRINYIEAELQNRAREALEAIPPLEHQRETVVQALSIVADYHYRAPREEAVVESVTFRKTSNLYLGIRYTDTT